MIRLLLYLLAFSAFHSSFAWAECEQPGRVTIAHINDVYEIESSRSGNGGFAKIKTVVDRIKQEDPETIFTHGGDFLSPSLMSGLFFGQQMIDALNAAGLDITTFGNHEFDFGDDVLKRRMAESRFIWLASNLLKNGKHYHGSIRYLMKKVGCIEVGFIGLITEETKVIGGLSKETEILDIYSASREVVTELKQNGANLIIALTHLDTDQDRQLARDVDDIDLILGGHDHSELIEQVNNTLIVKAGANARKLAKVDIILDSTGVLSRAELLPVDASVEENAEVAQVVAKWKNRLSKQLDTVVGETRTPLDATAWSSRHGETGLANFIADTMRKHTGAQVALFNGGNIRSNKVYPPGQLTKKDIFSILPFGSVICKIKVDGATISKALENGLSKYKDNAGRFPQISGISFRADISAEPGARVTEVLFEGKPIGPAEQYTLATNDYILEGGDGYDMFSTAEVILPPEYGERIADMVADEIKVRETIAPVIDDRMILGKNDSRN